jgi:polyisoprenoid-binding protein YceI
MTMRILKTGTAALLLAFTAAGVSAEVKTYELDKAHSEVGFQTRYVVGKVNGRFTEFDGKFQGDLAKPEASSVEFTVKAASINTDNQKRDGHLRTADFFDVEKHPDITFKSEKIVAKGKDTYEATGPLTMHGVTKTVTLPVAVLGTGQGKSGQTVGLEIETVLNRKDYGIVWNRTLDTGGFALADDVKVDILLQLREAKPAASAPAK